MKYNLTKCGNSWVFRCRNIKRNLVKLNQKLTMTSGLDGKTVTEKQVEE